jgi:cytoskeletal protein CcmA (bactofilin family)
MFGKSKGDAADYNRDSSSAQEVNRSAVAHPASPAAREGASSISSGLSIVGKIVGEGTLGIFGHVEGEVHASTVQIGDGAQVEGNIVAEELTIAGRVKGTIHANRVKLNSTAVVEGDIYHRSLAIEENAQFEGMSRRQENVIDTPSLVPAKRVQAPPVSNDVNGQGAGAPEGLNPPQATPIDRNRRGKATSDDPAHSNS